jgi:hypothetical protein
MKSDYEKLLEAELERELKALPELKAPESLSRRVLAEIRHRRALPWYHQSWQHWPMPLRVLALSFLCLMFGGLCLASWQLTRAAGVSAALQEVGELFSGLKTIGNLITVLGGTIVVIAKSLGTGFIILCFSIAGLGYALCLTVGAAWVRLASAHRS